jgi:regulator of sigma E protease
VLALTKRLGQEQGTLTVQVVRLAEPALPGVMAQVPELVSVTLEKQPGEGLAALGAEHPDLYLARVYPESPAANAGLRPGARLVAVNERPLTSFGGFQVAIARAGDQPFQLTYRVGAEERTVPLQKGKFFITDPLGQKVPVPGIGVAAGTALARAESPNFDKITLHFGPWEAMRTSLQMVPDVISKTLMVLGRLVTRDLPFETVGGPIMMYQLAGRSAEEGLNSFLHLMAVISVNLGIMNLLPIPILDGFHLLAAFWEGIRRRPIPARVREVANMVGLAMLLILMALVFKSDIQKLLQ